MLNILKTTWKGFKALSLALLFLSLVCLVIGLVMFGITKYPIITSIAILVIFSYLVGLWEK